MKKHLLSALAFSLVSGIASGSDKIASANANSASRPTGIVKENIDKNVRAQDDFFRYAQGSWLKSVEIPADKSDWGTFMIAREEVQQQLRGLVAAAAQDDQKIKGTERQKIGDLYNSYMDQRQLESLGLAPLKGEFERIAALSDKAQIAALIAHYNQIGVGAPYNIDIHQDNRASTEYIADLGQAGLGMPNRDFYLKLDDARIAEVRAKYQQHVEKMLSLAGHADPAAQAKVILELETELARVQWSAVENRDPVKGYNKLDIAALHALTPGYDWASYLAATGMQEKIKHLNVSQPSYLQGFNAVVKKTPLTAWKSYFEWHVLNSFAPYLASAFVDEDFAFKGKVLAGTKENMSREKRGVALTDRLLGESLGKLYVEKYFPAERKARTGAMVNNFLQAFKESIDSLDWMSPATKKEAQIKLSKMSVKVGYPNQWRDYSALDIVEGDLLGNLLRARMFRYQLEAAKLGKPIDREEWHMTPQTVNAYYSPEMNEIVFPAARMQPPLYDVEAEDAINYGALGISIGHEISHAFDDAGSQYDGDGNLRDWWTKEDRVKFSGKAQVLVTQYNGYSPLPGHTLNGALTLGENIADNVGIVMALKAYKISLAGKPAPVIDGWSAEQRLFMGLAQARRNKSREQRALALIKTDPHSPGEFRVNGSLKNLPEFYQAFDVKAGDKMYLPPAARVSIW
jgi:putative endopeptidase